MPATNAVSERPFSALKRIKTYIRSMSSDKEVNHLMPLHIHKEQLGNIDMVAVASEFIRRFDNRKQSFGKVSQSDMPKRIEVLCKTTRT